jgi:hypothetical protein
VITLKRFDVDFVNEIQAQREGIGRENINGLGD